MPSVTIELDDYLYSRIEADASELEETVEEFIIQGLAEALRQQDILNAIRARNGSRSSREGFEKVLAAVPDVPPIHSDDVIVK